MRRNRDKNPRVRTALATIPMPVTAFTVAHNSFDAASWNRSPSNAENEYDIITVQPYDPPVAVEIGTDTSYEQPAVDYAFNAASPTSNSSANVPSADDEDPYHYDDAKHPSVADTDADAAADALDADTDDCEPAHSYEPLPVPSPEIPHTYLHLVNTPDCIPAAIQYNDKMQ